jgi:hypothetical protein
MAISTVKALQEFFSKPPHGRKVEISEFKELTTKDKIELSEMLTAEGIEHEPYKPPQPQVLPD